MLIDISIDSILYKRCVFVTNELPYSLLQSSSFIWWVLYRNILRVAP